MAFAMSNRRAQCNLQQLLHGVRQERRGTRQYALTFTCQVLQPKRPALPAPFTDLVLSTSHEKDPTMSAYSDSDGDGDSDSGSDTSGSGSDISSTYSGTRGSAACAKTFDTAELLETILLFLPLRDLLRAQQICKSWSMSIRASIKAQRALSLEPQSDETSLFLRWDAMSDNPRPAWPYFHKGDWISAIDAETLQPTLNPLLTRNFFFKPRAGIYPATFITLHHNGIISPH